MTGAKPLHEPTIQYLLAKGADAGKPFHPELGSVLMAYLMNHRENEMVPSLSTVHALLAAGANPDSWVDAGYAGMVEAHMIADGRIKDFPDHSDYVETDPVWLSVIRALRAKSRMYGLPAMPAASSAKAQSKRKSPVKAKAKRGAVLKRPAQQKTTIGGTAVLKRPAQQKMTEGGVLKRPAKAKTTHGSRDVMKRPSTP